MANAETASPLAFQVTFCPCAFFTLPFTPPMFQTIPSPPLYLDALNKHTAPGVEAGIGAVGEGFVFPDPARIV